MSQSVNGDVEGTKAGQRWLASLLSAPRRLLKSKPEFHTRRFWVVQGLILAIAIVHDTIEIAGWMPHLRALYFLPITLFLLPVVYAGLHFGLGGAVATVMWVTVLTVPNWFLWHSGSQRVGVIVQFAVINGISVLVGWRVDRERSARRHAETANTKLGISEARYKHLFDTSPVGVLFLDSEGVILQANEPAMRLAESPQTSIEGKHLSDIVGEGNANAILGQFSDATLHSNTVSLKMKSGRVRHFLPVIWRTAGLSDAAAVQLVLRDVTDEQNQRAGLKAYAAHVIRAQEEERQRIARELHDEIVQRVILLCMKLDSAESLSEGSLPDLSKEIKTARTTAERVVEGLRDFATSLRPPLLDELGLVASIRKMLTDLQNRCGMTVHLSVDGDLRRFSQDTEIGLYRIVQEAVHNVERHARAHSLNVALRFDEREINIEIIDDGVGFDLDSTVDLLAGAHLGLVGMKERAELLGGVLTIDSTPGQGTRVSVAKPIPVPVKSPEHAAGGLPPAQQANAQ